MAAAGGRKKYNSTENWATGIDLLLGFKGPKVKKGSAIKMVTRYLIACRGGY